jgi:hypothetical protein
LKKLFVNIFPFLFKTQWLVSPEHEVKLAFVHEGVEYFAFVNEQNMPAERAFSAMDVYEQLNQRITKEYLDVLFAGLHSALNKGDLVKAGNLVTFAQQRSTHITNVEILYKLASVLYFTKEENCYRYDHEYNEKKIAGWKKSRDIDAFFLATPIKDFLPSFDGSNLNTLLYTQIQNKELMSNMNDLLLLLSEHGSDKDMLQSLISQREALKKWNDSLA